MTGLSEIHTEPPRDRFGRYLVPDPDGGKPIACSRATTVAKAIEDQGGLIKWHGRMVATGLVTRSDLYDLLPKAVADGRTALGKLCEQAAEAGSASQGANRGTALHHAVEMHNRGLEVPDMHAGRVKEYAAALHAAGFDVVEDSAERVVASPAMRIAGTFDMVLRDQATGIMHVADLKTGSVGYPHSFAVQLAFYATATHMLSRDYAGLVTPFNLDAHRGVIVHLPADGEGCELHWINLQMGIDALKLAVHVRTYRQSKDLLSPIASSPAPTSATVAEGTVETPSTGPGWMPPEEGSALNGAKWRPLLTAGTNRVCPMGSPQRGRLTRWVAEAETAGRGIRFDPPTQRRWQIARATAHLAVAASDDDTARDYLSMVTGAEVQPTVTVGAALGALTIAEAERLRALAEAGE